MDVEVRVASLDAPQGSLRGCGGGESTMVGAPCGGWKSERPVESLQFSRFVGLAVSWGQM